ncbi:MAG: hypothetical protein AAF791_00785 [Bacteroidota bacterium]
MSRGSLLAFLALVLFVVGALLVGVWRTSPASRRGVRTGATALGLAVWMGATAVLAQSGRLSQFDTLPPPALPVLVGLLIGTIVFALSPIGRRLAHGVPLAALVGVQVFRVPLELLLHRLYTEGVLPVQVTYEGWNYDIATGLLALLLAGALWRTRVPRAWVAAWNGLGLVLVAVVVSTAVLSLPTPFQQFTAEPTTVAVVSTVPLIWLPTVLVQAAVLGHVLVFRRLFGTAPSDVV